MMSDLPANVRPVPDRHGKTRYRFRRKGWPSAYLPGEPGSAEFHRSYAAIIELGPLSTPVVPVRAAAPRSLDDLIARLKASNRWKGKAPRTQLVQGRVLERFADRTAASGLRYGARPVANVSVGWLENVFGTMHETPAAANVLRKVLKGLLDHAIRLEWRTDNPVLLTDGYKEGDGLHTWTDDEIEQYRAKHPLGSMARLALELALNTAARRCNVTAIERDHIRDGRIVTAHVKGNNVATVPLLASTKAAIDALPAAPIRHLITTAFGKPFTVAGFGNRMRKWCDEAGLPQCSIHGLRKACARRLAESGATDAEGQAVTGHKKAETFAYYRAAANRGALAASAMARLEQAGVQPVVPNDVQPQENEGGADA